jgi:hypothetical protein
MTGVEAIFFLCGLVIGDCRTLGFRLAVLVFRASLGILSGPVGAGGDSVSIAAGELVV